MLGLPSLEEKMQQMKGAGVGGAPRRPGAPPRRPTDRGGYVSTDLLTPAVTVVKAANEVAKGIVDYAVRDLVDRVRRYGTPSARQTADLAEAAINTGKAALGKLTPELTQALKLTGGGISPGLHRAILSLQRVTRVPGKSYGISRIVDAVEGRAVALTATERQIVDALQKLTEATGAMLRANGVQQQDASGKWNLFSPTPGGKAWLRHMTPEGYGIVMKGPGSPGWNEFASAISDLNHIPRATVESTLRDVRDDLLGEGPDGSFRRINAEFTRQWKRVPTHLFVKNDVLPIFQTFPYSYAKSMAENTAARSGS